MRCQISVVGSSAKRIEKRVRRNAVQIGSGLAVGGCILLTGGATGVSFYAAKGAKESGGTVVALNPFPARVRAGETLNFTYADVVINSGFGFKGRNVLTINSADAVVVIAGAYGTLNEAVIALDLGKPVAVLADTGGVADLLGKITRTLGSRKNLSFFKDPDKAVEWTVRQAKKEMRKQASLQGYGFCSSGGNLRRPKPTRS